MKYTRRDVGRFTLAGLTAAGLTAGKLLAKPNSNFGGVQIGIIISPVLFRDMPLASDQILKNVVELGISAIEMQDLRVETYAGAPIPARRNPGTAPLTPEERQAARKAAQDLRQWRISASMDKYKALREMYHAAGVNIFAFRLASVTKETPEAELEYFFNTAQALGANQITMELPADAELTQRLGDYAAKHKILMGYHNHTQVNFNSWDTALAQSKSNGINFDTGHFAAAVSQSPLPFIEKHYDRITCLHLKDRKFGAHGGQNVPWGQGDTPLKEILLLMRQKKYQFPAGIELEYPIPETSNTMAEIAKCLRFCQDALA